MTRPAYFAIRPPPTTKMAMMAGTIKERMNANFQFLKNAITKAEKNAASAVTTTAIYHH
jgi:hypothetical protein